MDEELDPEDLEGWYARHIRDRLREIYETKFIEDAEVSLSEVVETHHHDTPMPMTCHPALSHCAEFVRAFDKDAVFAFGVRPIATGYISDKDSKPETDLQTNKILLTRSWAVGPAPFVGDPRLCEARYEWPFWKDKHGRTIGGSTKLVWRRTPIEKEIRYFREQNKG